MFYKVVRALCAVFLRLAFRFRVVGLENVPDGGGFILAANHRSNWDPVLAGIPVKRHKVCYMAKAELFQKNALFARIITALGAFPIERGKGDTGAIDWADRIITGGGVLGMFPEGTRSKTGTPGRPKSGVAMIAQQTGADVVPCAVCFGERIGFRSPVTVRYGKPIENARFGFGAEIAPHEHKEASRLVMDEIVRLLEDGI